MNTKRELCVIENSQSLATLHTSQLATVTGGSALPPGFIDNMKASIRTKLDQSMAAARAAMSVARK